jgi:hypothetical protein
MFKRLCFGALLLAGFVMSFNGCNTASPSGLTTIVISPATVTVALAPPGIQQGYTQYTATGYYGHAGHQSTQDITNQVTWATSGGQVATISKTGLATVTGFDTKTGIGWVGTTNITASAPGFNGTIVSNTSVFNVTDCTICGSGGSSDVSAITIVPATQTVSSLNVPVQFEAIGMTVNGESEVLNGLPGLSWTSSLPSVAANPNNAGQTSTLTAGVTTITANFTNADGSGANGSAILTVAPSTNSSAEPYVSMAIFPATQTLTAIGQQAKFIAIGTTSTGSTVDLTNGIGGSGMTWSSSDASGKIVAPISAGVYKAVSGGAVAITATFHNSAANGNASDLTSVTATASLTINTGTSSSAEPLTSVTIFPPTPTVSLPGESSQLLAIGSFSASPATQDVTTGITALGGVTGQNITTNWSSSDLGVATVATVPSACPSPVNGAISCTLSACPSGNKTETCSTCTGTNTTASGIYCATSNLVTPIGTVTGVNKGSSIILAISANPDGTLVPSSTAFNVLNGVTQEYTALTIYPSSGQSATAPAQQSQFLVLGTDGTTGLSLDLTDQVQWCSSNPTIATIGSTSTIATTADCANVNKALSNPPTLPELDPSTPGVATALASGTTNITAIFTNPNNGGQVVASVGYSVTIGAAQEPLISINVIPAAIAVTTKGQSGQFLAFGTYTTTPTVRDLTDEVTWYTSTPELASIESAGTSGETGGVATAMGYTGDAVIYAFDTNPDKTAVVSNAVKFTCKDPIANECLPGPAPVLLATLTVYNSGQINDTGENQSTWLVTADDDQGKPNLIHCGPGSEIAGLGNSVCTGTYASGSVAPLHAWLADPATGQKIAVDNTFGGWSSNCNTSDTGPAFTVTSVTFGATLATIQATNTMAAGTVGVFKNLTGTAAVLNGLYYTVYSAGPEAFQVVYAATTPSGPNATGGTFTTEVSTPDLLSTCSIPMVTNESVGAIFYSLSLKCSATTSGKVGTAFNSSAITVSDGTGPYVFSVIGTPLPAGLTLNTGTGAVTGTPTASSGSGTPFVAGPFSITATDANGTQASAASACAITISQ